MAPNRHLDPDLPSTSFVAARVLAVHRSAAHDFHKVPRDTISVLEGHGVVDDAHAGTTVQHRSRVARDPSQPNLRQIHLIHHELLDELRTAGFSIAPGELGENITTIDLPLLALPTGTRLRLGPSAVVEITGLRNPCGQLDRFQAGLRAACLDRDDAGGLVRKAGVMGIVIASGQVGPDDPIVVQLPVGAHRPLEPV